MPPEDPKAGVYERDYASTPYPPDEMLTSTEEYLYLPHY